MHFRAPAPNGIPIDYSSNGALKRSQKPLNKKHILDICFGEHYMLRAQPLCYSGLKQAEHCSLGGGKKCLYMLRGDGKKMTSTISVAEVRATTDPTGIMYKSE